jgi:hypothetical protein
MPQTSEHGPGGPEGTYQDGFRAGIATAALAVSIVAFLSVIGLEKSLLAGVLGFLALRGGLAGRVTTRRGRLALIFAGVHIILVIVVVALYHEEVYRAMFG